jgi:putative ABC transport system permease protein
MNKMLRANNQFDVKVTGIYKAFPSNSHMHPGVLVSFNTLKDPAIYGAENLRTNWGIIPFSLFCFYRNIMI